MTVNGSIAGMVTDENSGNPVAGAIVEAFYEQELLDVNSAADGFRAVTNESGHYLIDNLPSGKYLVRAIARTYLHEYYDNAASKADADIVVCPANAPSPSA